jgi:Na+-transporting NADH:ubiquinone oxidoreductase subunit A
MSDFVVKAGLDLPIAGSAQGTEIQTLAMPAQVAITPPDYPGYKIRLAVKEGDSVQAGQALGYAKLYPDMKFTSPAAGKVVEIRRGHRRSIEAVVVETAEGGTLDHGALDLAAIAALGADGVKARLLAGGAWLMLRAKPLARIANPQKSPKAILVSAMETGPNCAAVDVLLEGREAELAAGFAALKQLAPTLHLTHAKSGVPAALKQISELQTHSFSGPHPAGDAEFQINKVCSPGTDQQVWFCRAVDVADMGALLLNGKASTRSRIAVVGDVAKPLYVEATNGSPVADLLAAAGGSNDETRLIGGSVLTGRGLEGSDFLGYGAHTLSVLREGGVREFMGWLGLGANKFSNHRLFLSSFLPSKKRSMTTDVHGAHRALVPIGSYNRVVDSDIEPNYLMKAILCEDIEEMLALGLLEMSQEEAALCTVVCPSKINYSQILQDGWLQYEKETA